MWQSRVEIKHYSVRISIALLRSKCSSAHATSAKGRAHTRSVNVVSIREFTKPCP